MYFSLIRLRRDVSPKEIAGLVRGDGYSLHKLVWNLFSDGPDRKRDFLYRYETVNDWPTFYAVSARKPEGSSGLWEIHAKKYEPKLSKGEQLAFSLRVNPIRSKRDENNHQHRHDVVMEAKSRLGFKELPHHNRPHVATLIQEAGFAWLKAREKDHGFLVSDDKEKTTVRVDGYCQHKVYKRKGGKLITFSTLDFNGLLTVTDPTTFVESSLFGGLGPAKGLGCGLMLVRRI